MPPPPTDPKVKVGSTGNDPESPDRIAIAAASSPGKRRKVVLSLGSDSDTDLPLPDIQTGDRLRIFVELEVTTNPDPRAPGLIGSAYRYAPKIEATLLAAKGPSTAHPRPGRAIPIGSAWLGDCKRDKHHQVICFGDFGIEADELDWGGPYRINVTLDAAHRSAKPNDKLLVGQNETTKVVGTDMAGIRVVRLRPGDQAALKPEYTRRRLVHGIPVSPRALGDGQWVSVYSHELKGLRRGEQLLVKAVLNTDASALRYPARVSTRLFLAEGRQQTEPGGKGQDIASWKGHLSKSNGVNRLRVEGVQPSHKFGVAEVRKAASKPLFVNLVAVCSDPHGGAKKGDKLAVRGGGFVEVTRYPPEMNG